ncbi:MAG: right-handed parallel beta-helix repeat-containing protein [Methylophaga sp.]|uniref:hypothetical protein n=1 Tax=Methylophaga sp. TaxID=2024840 RepID=UPI000C0D71CC|nr:hypothetical protein [Methylophaga sp.]MBL1457691.1 right-handed parallel beta-helix repeat-containing protein [Methylophaga sp.]
MKTCLLALTMFFIGSHSLASSGQNYFFCDSGSDKHNGKSELAPFKSVEKLFEVFKWMDAGDSILLCRGGKFEYSHSKKLYNYRCTADKPCTITDYGDKNAPRPELHYSGTHSGLWFSDAPKFRADGGYNISNIKLTSEQQEGYAIFIADEVNDFHVDNVHVEGFGIGFHSAGSGPNPFTNRMHDRVSLTNSIIINNSAQGFLGACNDCLIENNVFENNGYARAIFNHNIYVGFPSSKRYKNMTIRNNKLYQSAMFGDECAGTSLVAHGNIDNLIIEDNLLKEDKHAVQGHCYGISIAQGYGDKVDESFHNVIIRRNRLINLGAVGIGCASCNSAIITENVIIDESGVMTRGIAVPERAEESIKSNNILIAKNKIYMVNSTGAAISLGGQHVFKVTDNVIRVPDAKVLENCFKLAGANANNDMSSNECLSHDSKVNW